MSTSTTLPTRWQRGTRWLHGLIAIGIIGQLALSQLMTGPDHLDTATTLQKNTLELHEWLGLATVALMLAHWLWLFLPNSDVHLSKLFPWNKAGRSAVWKDISYLNKNKQLPPLGAHGGLSGMVHGLGFLVASMMALSGLGIYLVLDFGGGPESHFFEPLATVHALFANLMWAYLIAHVLMAAWHEYKGERLISKMFRG